MGSGIDFDSSFISTPLVILEPKGDEHLCLLVPAVIPGIFII